MSNANDYIQLSNVTKNFVMADRSFLALDNITTGFNQGEFTAVVGRSGSGKSTLMNMITGIDHPTDGSIRIDELAVDKMPETAMSKWRLVNLGIVFQFYQLIPVLTLLENVMLPMHIANRIPFNKREDIALDLLDTLDLKSYAHRRPYHVSGGQQQSTAIARALANDPPILIADEPTGNLSYKEAGKIIDIFSRLSSEGKTVVMVTHDNDLAQQSERILQLSDGRIIADQPNSREKAI